MHRLSIAFRMLVLAVAAGLLSPPAAAAEAQTPPTKPSDKVLAAKIAIPSADAVSSQPKPVDGVPQYLPQKDAPYIVVTRPVPNSKKTYDLYLVQTRDEILAPMGLRKPPGKGPFPAVLLGYGGGGGSFEQIDAAMYNLEPMIDELIRRGYAVAYGNPRTMAMNGFNRGAGQERPHRVEDTVRNGTQTINSAPALDSDDFISFIEQLKSLPFVRPDAVASMGVGRSGELAVEAAMFTSWATAVSSEGTNWEVTQIDLSKAPHDGRSLLLEERNIDQVRQLANKAATIDRLKQIKTPMINMGRGQDKMSGLYRVLYEWEKEAGVDAQWGGFNNPRYGYVFPTRKPAGGFVSPMEMQAMWDWMGEIDKRIDKTGAAKP